MITVEDKQKIFEACKKQLEDKIGLYDQQIRELRESANGETKSSSGDKYETGRSMIQLEIENAEKQKGQLAAQLQGLIRLTPKITGNDVPGRLIEMQDGTIYYISVGLGKLIFQDRTIWAISGNSPIAQAIENKKTGDQVSIQKKLIVIVNSF